MLLFLDYFSYGKRHLITQNMLAHGLPKAYDCHPHDLLIAKLEASGLDKTSLH